MSQISPPIRIVLAVAVVFLAAWMTVLKPKSDTSAPAATAPATTPQGNLAAGKNAVSAPGKLVQKARDAATAQSDQQQAAATGEPDTAATPSTGTATAPATTGKAASPAAAAMAKTLDGVPAPVVKAILKQRVLVLGFFEKGVPADRSVRRALAKVDRWDGRVVVKAVPLSQVGKYSRVTSGAQVDQTPSVVVVDRALKATTISGWTNTMAIDQAVVDALRASGGLFTSPFLRKVNAACSRYGNGFLSIAQPNSPAQLHSYVDRHVANLGSFAAEVRGTKAPARYAAFKAGMLADVSTLRSGIKDWGAAMGKHPTAASFVAATVAAGKKLDPVDTRLQSRMDKHHLISCS